MELADGARATAETNVSLLVLAEDDQGGELEMRWTYIQSILTSPTNVVKLILSKLTHAPTSKGNRMPEKIDKKAKKLKLNKKSLETLDDNHLEKVSGGGPSFAGSGCISIRTGCCPPEV